MGENSAKGLTELLDAVSQVDDVTLTIVGPVIPRLAGGNARWVHEIVADLGLAERVTLAGKATPEAARATYREHDVFVLPSHGEGFSNAILEAMEAGIPVIATLVGAASEILRDGTDGFLVDAGDAVAVADRLRWLKVHPHDRIRMGRSARARVRGLFSVERVAALWVDLYRQAAGTG